MAIEHKMLVAIEAPAVRTPGGNQPRVGRVPGAVLFCTGQGRHRLTLCNRRQQGLLLQFRAGVENGAGSEHGRREIRRAQQGAAHFLQHDALLGKTKAVATHRLRNAHCTQAEFAVERCPGVSVPSRFGLHQPTHDRRG